jgi:uncharacterized SAM-binding protein YcdF (DUF218 family)
VTELLRHVVDVLATPLVAALLLSIAAAMPWFRGQRRLAGAMWLIAGLIVYVFSLAPVGDALLAPLERTYRWSGAGAAPLPAVRYVVVLGSAYAPRAGVSPVAAEDREGLMRIVEGVRAVRRLPGARLVVSGGALPGHESVAHGYAELARDLGVEETSLIVLDQSLNTAAEARSIAAAIGSEPFLLVTSASHMRRAMRLMARTRAKAIPLPTAQQTGDPCEPRWACLVPSPAGLSKTQLAIHEYLGLAALDLGLE